MNLVEKWRGMNPPKLCYIKDSLACFTTMKDVTGQSGEDWWKAPYEHNSDLPREWKASMDIPRYSIVKLFFSSGNYETAADFSSRLTGRNHSSLSVLDINSGSSHWLHPTPECTIPLTPISAGVDIQDFVRLIQLSGGEVYYKIPDGGIYGRDY